VRVKVADFIADFLVNQEVKHNFTVPGGGAMHLNVAFGNKKGLENIFVQHEQSAAMAAESYSRLSKTLPLVCCTTGPGGTNTLTGVLGAWLDSIPLLVISGQVKSTSTVRSTGLPLRALGDQEFDILSMVKPITKYAEMITDAKMVKYHLQKALYFATTGRPGPVWLDIPLDIQGGFVEVDELIGFDSYKELGYTPPLATDEQILEVISRLRDAKRPVLNVGNGIRIAQAKQELDTVVDLLKIPVVTGFNSIDLMETSNEYYIGRAGLMGDRPGNWAIQNSDLLLSVGSRLSSRQVGYSAKNWARESFVIMVDIDEAELMKPTIHVELPIQSDVKAFLTLLADVLTRESPLQKREWLATCHSWKSKYPVVLDTFREQTDFTNVYTFMDELSTRLSKGQVTVTGNGSACVASSQAFIIKEGQRYILNSGAASMGYDLPAAIGACFATERSPIICLSGDGSIQMNLQELQTIVFHQLPIKIFVINNSGYHSMRQTQDNLFPELPHVGIGPETGDLSFPSIEKIATAYDIPYYHINSNVDLPATLDKVLAIDGYLICEIFVSTNQRFEPKSATRKLSDGTLVSPPLEDLAPFLPREELEQIMLIPLLEESFEQF
jgi:acetolactate synthase-1/2/3 large subunit